MAGDTFTKLFSSITESSIWMQPDPVRLTFITLLAMADRDGCIYASVPGLAHRARVSVADCEKALRIFMEPDRYSRTPDYEGRRIAPIDGGWRLLNHPKYRATRDPDKRREQNREAQARFRSRQGVSQSKPKVSQGQPRSAHADTDADAEEEREALRRRLLVWSEEFDVLWAVWLRKVGKGLARKTYEKMVRAGALPALEELTGAAIRLQATDQWSREGRRFQPHLSTWLNREGWEDEPEGGTSASGSPVPPERGEGGGPPMPEPLPADRAPRWERARLALKGSMDTNEWATWISPLVVTEETDERIVLCAPNERFAVTALHCYGDEIRSAVLADGAPVIVRCVWPGRLG